MHVSAAGLETSRTKSLSQGSYCRCAWMNSYIAIVEAVTSWVLTLHTTSTVAASLPEVRLMFIGNNRNQNKKMANEDESDMKQKCR